VIVEVQVAAQPSTSFPGAGVFMQVDLLIFDVSPKPPSEDIVHEAASPVHADLHSRRSEQARILRAGDVAPLVRVPDERLPHLQSAAGGSYHEGLDFSKPARNGVLRAEIALAEPGLQVAFLRRHGGRPRGQRTRTGRGGWRGTRGRARRRSPVRASQRHVRTNP